jgi:hypothetical protein
MPVTEVLTPVSELDTLTTEVDTPLSDVDTFARLVLWPATDELTAPKDVDIPLTEVLTFVTVVLTLLNEVLMLVILPLTQLRSAATVLGEFAQVEMTAAACCAVAINPEPMSSALSKPEKLLRPRKLGTALWIGSIA